MNLIHGYDSAGNRTSLDDSQGWLTSYTYDARNELVTITQSGTGVTAKRADFQYDMPGAGIICVSRHAAILAAPERNFSIAVVKGGGADSVGRGCCTSSFAVGVGRSGPSQTCLRSNGVVLPATRPLSPRPWEDFLPQGRRCSRRGPT